MGIRILEGGGEGDSDYMSCLYCSTAMQAFGPLFYINEDPQDFLEWLDKDAHSYSDGDLLDLCHIWREANKLKEAQDIPGFECTSEMLEELTILK